MTRAALTTVLVLAGCECKPPDALHPTRFIGIGPDMSEQYTCDDPFIVDIVLDGRTHPNYAGNRPPKATGVTGIEETGRIPYKAGTGFERICTGELALVGGGTLFAGWNFGGGLDTCYEGYEQGSCAAYRDGRVPEWATAGMRCDDPLQRDPLLALIRERLPDAKALENARQTAALSHANDREYERVCAAELVLPGGRTLVGWTNEESDLCIEGHEAGSCQAYAEGWVPEWRRSP